MSLQETFFKRFTAQNLQVAQSIWSASGPIPVFRQANKHLELTLPMAVHENGIL
ncbi:MAG: hypothetical protein U0894_16825 [Pirellulales bacterium]